MRLILEIASGKRVHQKAVLSAGQRVTFGRGERADITLPDDPQLAQIHFAICWDRQQAHLEVLSKRRGTQHNGTTLKPSENERRHDVGHCDWIRAGQTDWTVYYEFKTPPWDNREPHAGAANALRELRSLQEDSLYAILDSARDDRIRLLLHESTDSFRSLYDGVDGEAMADAAPYIVKLRPDSALLAALIKEGWGQRWGIYVTSEQSLPKLRRHLRRFLMVKDDVTEAQLYFRYYDPDAFHTFAEVITARQRGEFFVALQSVHWESPAGQFTTLKGQ